MYTYKLHKDAHNRIYTYVHVRVQCMYTRHGPLNVARLKRRVSAQANKFMDG